MNTIPGWQLLRFNARPGNGSLGRRSGSAFQPESARLHTYWLASRCPV
jgi:hypothetical protein